ncbi:FUSC family protein [Legionella impletisoli]|uniref:Integral membrane bound transporter domain-containing protein n=1 Tax=Legionella impletisoli TaxID=343510 RepID=A0A917NAE3_9GAMM|nr:FUSC family protein [Legionella impletisoli]GGI82813.1 hypothetical protein GCM10007966_09240 [Legionella impletisoli]
MNLRNTTKMGLQAAVAIAIAELISLNFKVERGYWITLTAMALTTQTWGESIKRSFERVGMTILGGAAGTALYFTLPANTELIVVFLLFFVFFTSFMMPIYHLIAVFFLTCFVVFLFALIGQWNWSMLGTRIIDTALGAAVALTVGNFLFPLKRNVTSMFVDYLKKIRASLTMVFNSKDIRTYVSSQNLAVEFLMIKKEALAIRYQLLFHRLNTQEFNSLLKYVGASAHYAIHLIESYPWLKCRLSNDEIPLVRKAAETTEENIKKLIELLEHKKKGEMCPAADVSCLLQREINTSPERFATLESDALGFYNLMYFFTELNANLNHVFDLLVKEQG